MNGFDRVADGEDNWLHDPRSLPPTPEEVAASLWSEVNAVEYIISIPARLGPGRRQYNLLTDLKDTSRMRNLPRSSCTWRGEVARRHR